MRGHSPSASGEVETGGGGVVLIESTVSIHSHKGSQVTRWVPGPRSRVGGGQ